MPLPLILGVGAVIAGTVGVGSGVYGAAKMKEANDTMKSADSRHKSNISKFESQSKTTSNDMDNLGKKELEILESFEAFTRVFEKIQGRPQFKTYSKEGVNIPEYDVEELKKVSIGAGLLLGGIGGAAVGTAGGFAAAGATTAAVMALGTASTGTAIASLSGVAATNATLAALGGGAIAAGGGGMALGTTILGAATLGVGLLVGGVIFSVTGSSLSNKADEAWSQMKKAEKEINQICLYLKDLSKTALKFEKALSSVNKIYRNHLNTLTFIVETNKKTDWNDFTTEEKLLTENTALLVNLLFNMGKVKLVLASENENEYNKVNFEEVDKSIINAEVFLNERGLSKGI
ncbi:Phage-related minor tail protein [uncultured Clostridium sp.]|nr:Phage-related minor tail protein [uncultured Clostridium sp.]SCI99435.1 Phage-related minor tail protein [uncultured Clostridium sp.]